MTKAKFDRTQHGYPQPSPQPPTRPNTTTIEPVREPVRWNVLHYVAAICMLVAIFIFPALILSRCQQTKPAVVAANVSTKTRAIDTVTPEPSTTPRPSRTPYPTLTHTVTVSDNMEEKPIIQNENNFIYVTKQIEVTRLVEVERVITTTPRPWTPSPTPNLTATQVEHETRLGRRYDHIQQYAVIVGAVALTAFLGALFVNGIYQGVTGIIDRRRAALEAVPPEPEASHIPVNDWRDEMRRQKIIRLREQGATLEQLERAIFPDKKSRGGWYRQKILGVLSEHDPLGEYGPSDK